MKALATLMGLLCVMLGSSAQAHIASNGFVVAEVSGEDIEGSIELAVRDVELAIGVDRNNDGDITWGELRASAPQLRQYVAERVFQPFAGLTDIVPSALGEAVVVHGALALARQRLAR